MSVVYKEELPLGFGDIHFPKISFVLPGGNVNCLAMVCRCLSPLNANMLIKVC